jgi:hypothetical protein
MILSKDLRSTERSLRAMVRELKQQRKGFPALRLMRTVSRGKEIYCKVEYDRGKRKRTVISYGDNEFFSILKGLVIDAKRELAEEDVKLITDMKKRYRDVSSQEVIHLMQEKYPKLDRHDIVTAVTDLEDEDNHPSPWALSDYVKSDYKLEEKIHTTSRGLKVRSKSELIICEIFYKYGIEFRYEEVIYINGKRLEPDFIIRRKSDGKIFYWEHCGMMELPKYRKRYYEKRDLYEFCDIVPWDNMIFTYDKDGSIDSEYIEAIVKTVLAV